jgi:molybdenum cofactor sulfurtransferase
LDFFKADPDHFDVIFVANATAAIKLVTHAFQDCASRNISQKKHGFWYGYHIDAHTSLVGVREVASAGSRCFKSDDEVEEWLQGESNCTGDDSVGPYDSKLRLFAYPAQSNMNGHRLPLNWAGRLRSSSYPMHENTYTMLDAAAYVSTAQLDLSDSDMAPDFTALSFYKIFGFPDLGALIVRKKAGHILKQRRYFGGGTVDMVIAADAAWHAKKEYELHEELEDGTLPFHSIIALDAALNTHQRLYTSMTHISAHTSYLAKALYDGLRSLHHGNGVPVCEIYKHAASAYGDGKTQGPTIAFNVRNSQSGWVGKSEVEKLAIVNGIQLRTGGVCNPGGIATSLKLKSWEMRKNFAEGVRCGNEVDIGGGKPMGIVRVSLGAMSNMGDVQHFVTFVRDVFVEVSPLLTLKPIFRTEEERKIQSIQIFPIRGAKSWLVPTGIEWEVNEGGLVWDREWCIVSRLTGEPLTMEDHPKIALLQPSLHLEEGSLQISLTTALDTPNETGQKISVSLWESPPRNPDRAQLTKAPPQVSPYTETSIADFLTSSLGIPCTLARYTDFRRGVPELEHPQTPKFQRFFTNHLPLEHSVTVSTSLETCPSFMSNIITTDPSSLVCTSWQYIRIGSSFFRSLEESPTKGLSVHKRHLRFMPNLFDSSPTAQYPTIRVGDPVQTLPANCGEDDPTLRACISSSFAADFICPVPSCRKELATKEDNRKHLLVHRVARPASSKESAFGVCGRFRMGSATGFWRSQKQSFLAMMRQVGLRGGSTSVKKEHWSLLVDEEVKAQRTQNQIERQEGKEDRVTKSNMSSSLRVMVRRISLN